MKINRSAYCQCARVDRNSTDEFTVEASCLMFEIGTSQYNEI